MNNYRFDTIEIRFILLFLCIKVLSSNRCISNLSSKIPIKKIHIIVFCRSFFFICLARFSRVLNAAGKLCSVQQQSSAHTSSRRSGELRINPIALSYFRPLRNGDGYNAVRWRDTDKRLARSRRHYPPVAFTLRAIPRRFARLIGTAEPTCLSLAIPSAAVSCKEENAGNQALQFKRGGSIQQWVERYCQTIQ